MMRESIPHRGLVQHSEAEQRVRAAVAVQQGGDDVQALLRVRRVRLRVRVPVPACPGILRFAFFSEGAARGVGLRLPQWPSSSTCSQALRVSNMQIHHSAAADALSCEHRHTSGLAQQRVRWATLHSV